MMSILSEKVLVVLMPIGISCLGSLKLSQVDGADAAQEIFTDKQVVEILSSYMDPNRHLLPNGHWDENVQLIFELESGEKFVPI